MALVLAVASALTGALAGAASYVYKKNSTNQFAPCSAANVSEPNSTPLAIPDALNQCTSTTFEMIYLSPNNNFLASGSAMEADGTKWNDYQVYRPSASINASKFQSNTSTWYNPATEEPLNMCPQMYTKDGATVSSASAVPMPLLATEPLVYIYSGPTAGNVLGGVAAISSTAQAFSPTLYIQAVNDVTLFLELGGARGGSVPVYTNGVDSTTGNPSADGPGYVGGAPGVVYGLYSLKTNDVLRVQLGSLGFWSTDPSAPPPFDGLGQGGLATTLAGANGGGASYAVHFEGVNAMEDAMNAESNGTLVCVAAGGGGASRNASGGDAGFGADKLVYGGSVSQPFGSAGGQSFFTGPAPTVSGRPINDFSGGGGVMTAGGRSNVPSPWPTETSSFGSRLQPFVTDGAGSVNTDTSAGGGGGGGGLYGGGAGGYNGAPKPNNIHGAGGGGSSWTGSLRPATSGPAVTLNAYRTSFGGTSQWDPKTLHQNGYLVLGIASSEEA